MGDINIKGFRKLATLLPKWLMPDPNKLGEHIIQTIHGVSLYINPSKDKGVELSLFLTGTYEKGVLHFIESHFTASGAFVDVGANIGLMSLFTSHRFPSSHVFAFEAHPLTLEILQKNIELNDLRNIEVFSFGLANENKKSVIYDNWQINRGGASVVVKDENSTEYPIELKRFDDLAVAVENIEMVKIDVEGFELEVLRGMENTIRRDKPILIIEISEERELENSATLEILDFINALEVYNIYKLSGGKERKSKLGRIKNVDELPSHDNIFCIAH